MTPSGNGATEQRPVGGVTPILELRDVAIGFRSGGHTVPAVRSASFVVPRRRIVGLVGESGSGKSVSALAALGLAPFVGARVTGGSIWLDGEEVTHASQRRWREIRGAKAGMVFQQPRPSLNPAWPIGRQIAHAARRHSALTRSEARGLAIRMLDQVKIDDPTRRAGQYPHELSGGMCQRVMLALALVNQPQLLIADEPTTALDVTVQRHVLDLVVDLQRSLGLSVLLITHDLGVVADVCDEIVVMYSGQVVEQGATASVLRSPAHPYTAALVRTSSTAGSASGRFDALEGTSLSPAIATDGCRFADRCEHVGSECRDLAVALEGPASHSVRCLRAAQLRLSGVA